MHGAALLNAVAAHRISCFARQLAPRPKFLNDDLLTADELDELPRAVRHLTYYPAGLPVVIVSRRSSTMRFLNGNPTCLTQSRLAPAPLLNDHFCPILAATHLVVDIRPIPPPIQISPPPAGNIIVTERTRVTIMAVSNDVLQDWLSRCGKSLYRALGPRPMISRGRAQHRWVLKVFLCPSRNYSLPDEIAKGRRRTPIRQHPHPGRNRSVCRPSVDGLSRAMKAGCCRRNPCI